MIEADHRGRMSDGRSLAALRGDTRDKLDGLLLRELMGTGIGRSAFIQASIDLYRGLDPETQDRFCDVAGSYERELAR